MKNVHCCFFVGYVLLLNVMENGFVKKWQCFAWMPHNMFLFLYRCEQLIVKGCACVRMTFVPYKSFITFQIESWPKLSYLMTMELQSHVHSHFANIFSPVFTSVMEWSKWFFFIIFAYSFHYHLLHTKLKSKTMILSWRVLFFFQHFVPNFFFRPRSAVNTFVPLHTFRTHILILVEFSWTVVSIEVRTSTFMGIPCAWGCIRMREWIQKKHIFMT